MKGYRSLADDTSCCDIDSPSCVLTNLLIADELKRYKGGRVPSVGRSLINASTLTSLIGKQSGSDASMNTRTGSDVNLSRSQSSTGVDVTVGRVPLTMPRSKPGQGVRYACIEIPVNNRYNKYPRIITPSRSNITRLPVQRHFLFDKNNHGQKKNIVRREVHAVLRWCMYY